MNELSRILGPQGPIAGLLKAENVRRFLIGLGVAIVLLILFKLLRMGLRAFLKHRIPSRAASIAEKVIHYTGFVIVGLIVMEVIGLDVRALLGAAGIAGIAVGFAAQTSIANIISGLFLLSEKSFSEGDVIRSAETIGTVTKIDLLSVRLRTFDNLQVRLPNEALIKNTLINLSRYPIRRLNVDVLVGHGQDLEKFSVLLKDLAGGVKEILMEPEPFFMVDSFTPEGVQILLGVWVRQTDIVKAKNALCFSIQKAFSAQGLPYPTSMVKITEDDGLKSEALNKRSRPVK